MANDDVNVVHQMLKWERESAPELRAWAMDTTMRSQELVEALKFRAAAALVAAYHVAGLMESQEYDKFLGEVEDKQLDLLGIKKLVPSARD